MDTNTMGLNAIHQALLKADFGAALGLLEALPADSQGWEVYFLRGTTLGLLDRFALSEAAFQHAMLLNPNAPEIMTAFASMLMRSGKMAEAESLLDSVLKIDASFGDAHFQLGLLYFQLDDFAAARPCFDRAIAVLPKASSPLTLQARTCMGLQDYGEATRLFMAAVQCNPEDVEAHYYASELWLLAGEVSRAITALEAVVRLNPKHELALRQLGLVYFQLSRYDDALPILKKCVAIDPKNTDYQFRFATCLLETGSYSTAITAFDAMLKKDPQNVVLMCSKAMVYIKSKSFSEAMGLLKEAAHTDQNTHLPFQYMGALFLTMGRYEDGVKAFAKAIRLSPNDPDLYQGQGSCCLGLNLFSDAVQSFETAARLSDGVQYQIMLAQAYMKAGQKEDCRRCLKNAAEKYPDMNSVIQRFLSELDM